MLLTEVSYYFTDGTGKTCASVGIAEGFQKEEKLLST